MDARTVSQAANELVALKRLTLERLAVALGAALVAGPAALLEASLAVAFAAGAVFGSLLALMSATQRRALVASLAIHREAYLLPEVRRHGTTLVTMKSRRRLARSIASMLKDASGSRVGVELVDRATWQAPALAALARALIEPKNVVEPTAMAACVQLLTDGHRSPLLNPALSRTDLDRTLRHIHAGISPPLQPDARVTVDDRRQVA